MRARIGWWAVGSWALLACGSGGSRVAPGADDADERDDSDARVDTVVADTDLPRDTLVDTDPPRDTEPVDTVVVDTDLLDTDPPAFPTCPLYRSGQTTGFTPLFTLTEVSGVAASRRNPGVLWVHNDSGSDATIHAITPSGRYLGGFPLGGASAEDWEDIDVGPGPVAGATYVYVGDIGDNGGNRNTIDVYRVREPKVSLGSVGLGTTLHGVERLVLAYPDGGHNAETMMVDPLTGDVYVVAKAGSGVSPVYRARAPLAASGAVTMELVTTLQFGQGALPGGAETTGGDISPSGELVAIRTYDHAFVWRRPAGATVDQALATDPCEVPQEAEGQGEAFGFAASGAGYYTIGEGSLVPIHFHARR